MTVVDVNKDKAQVLEKKVEHIEDTIQRMRRLILCFMKRETPLKIMSDDGVGAPPSSESSSQELHITDSFVGLVFGEKPPCPVRVEKLKVLVAFELFMGTLTARKRRALWKFCFLSVAQMLRVLVRMRIRTRIAQQVASR